jgi:hypothetical protein
MSNNSRRLDKRCELVELVDRGQHQMYQRLCR